MLIEGTGKNVEDLWYTNTVGCPTLTPAELAERRIEIAKPVKAAELKACRPRVIAEIAAIQPEIIVAFGQAAVAQLFGSEAPAVVYHTGEVHEAQIPGALGSYPVSVMLCPTLTSLFSSNDFTPGSSWDRAHAAFSLALKVGFELRQMRSV